MLMVDCQAADARPEGLAAALHGAGVVAVVLCTSGPKGHVERDLARAQVAACQAAGAAALIAGDAALALALGADGVHLPAGADLAEREQAYRAARTVLGPTRTVGVSAGLLRHDAMVLGELGADYIGFEAVPGDDPSALRDVVAWWAELFEMPCVALGVKDAGAARELAATGADFVAAGPDMALTASLAVLAGLGNLRGVSS